MKPRDPAFQWETEALRESSERRGRATGGRLADSSDSAPSSGDDHRPPETMIVPIAAWDKMLMQLGNLHEAGQQLAEARERAAKAETEARFLRERLAELRVPQPAPGSAPADEPHDTATDQTAPLEDSQHSGVLARVGRRVGALRVYAARRRDDRRRRRT
jgi:hypothetical protein